MLSVIAVLSASLLVSSPPLTAQDTSLWRYTTTEKIEFYRLTPLGDLLVGTKDEVVVLDPETREVRWTRNDILKKPGGLVINPAPLPGAAFDPIPFSPYGVVRTNDGIAMIDLGTGETMWDSTAVPLEKVRGHLTVPQHKMVLVYGETPESKRTLIAVDVVTGEVGWRQDTLFRRSSPNLQRINSLRSLTGHQPPLVDSDSTFILNLSKDGPMRIHSRTGELLWRLDLNKNPPLLREGYAPMLYDSGVLFVPYDKKLVAVNTSDGSVIWDRRRNFRSRLTQMELTSHGLVVRGRKPPEREYAGPDEGFIDKPATNFFLDLVDAETGTSVWPTSVRDVRIDTPFIVDGDAIFVTKEREFVALDFLDASRVTIAEFEFEDGAQPDAVQIVGVNFLLSSGGNFLSLDRGAVRYYRYYPGPGLSLVETVALSAGYLAFDAITGSDTSRLSTALADLESWAALAVTAGAAEFTAGAAEFTAGAAEFRAELLACLPAALVFGSECPSLSPAVFTALTVVAGAAIVEVVEAVDEAADVVAKILRREIGRSQAGYYRYVYTEQPLRDHEGFSLVKLDIRNGEEAGRVWIGDRRPDYLVDPISGFVFVKENDKEIVAFRFAGT